MLKTSAPTQNSYDITGIEFIKEKLSSIVKGVLVSSKLWRQNSVNRYTRKKCLLRVKKDTFCRQKVGSSGTPEETTACLQKLHPLCKVASYS